MAASTNPVLSADLSIGQVCWPKSLYSYLVSKLVMNVHLLLNTVGCFLH